MELTESQKQAVATLASPLFIQAGAGTGKTHTLTHRLTYAFSPGSGAVPGQEDAPMLTDAGEFITITFTNKAAGELLGRMRTALRSAGLDEAALEVDSAWISTIHAMCKRLLVEHALDTGIDASAELIEGSVQDYYLAHAYDRFLEVHSEDARLKELFEDYDGASGVFKLMQPLINAVVVEREGFSHIDLGPDVLPDEQDASPLLRVFAERLEVAQAEAQALIDGGNKNKGPLAVVAFCSEQLEGIQTVNRAPRAVHAFAVALKPPTMSGAALEDIAGEVHEALAQLLLEATAAKQRIDLKAVLGYTREVVEDYSSFKQRNSLMDTDELLARAYALLAENPSIAQSYQEQFKLVMIDEFQDTDRLQVGIIEHLVPDDLHSLATVGDRQQAIYGFRGADVTVFNEQQAKMEALGGKSVSLDSNYRSHDQILRFVDTLFGQPQVFGNELIELSRGRKEAEPYIAESEPRVRVLMAAGKKNDETGKLTGLPALREDKARMIAEQFAKLRNEQGCAPSDMVILLGKMSNVSIYREALREQGFESRLTGGSTFFQMTEVRILIEYLKALSNPYDSPAVLASLMSPFYNLSDSELLSIAGTTEPYKGLLTYTEHEESLVKAVEQFKGALSLVDQVSTAELLRSELLRSGWQRALAEQGAEGTMVLANIEKFIRLVEEHESSKGVGLVKAAAYFGGLLADVDAGVSLKENPGVLQESSTDAVQIMTIHASKGLEFPIVAVAEFEEGVPREAPCYVVQDSNGIYPSLSVKPASKSVKGTSKWAAYFQERYASRGERIQAPSEAHTAMDLYSFIRRDAREQDEAEDKRVFYVACTRAREVLIIATCDKNLAYPKESSAQTEETPTSTGRTGLLADVETALFGSNGYPVAEECFEASFSFGSDAPGAPRYQGHYRFCLHSDDDDLVLSGEESENIPSSDAAPFVAARHEAASRGEADAEEVISLITRVGEGPVIVPILATEALSAPEVSSAPVQQAPQLLSYSLIASMQGEPDMNAGDDNQQDVPSPATSATEEATSESTDLPIKAVDFGSAFHLAAERWLRGISGTLAEEVERALRFYHLDISVGERLQKALIVWTGSKRASELLSYPLRFAEYPFVVPLPGSVPLQGSIDALGVDRTLKKALICDYKTGETGMGEPEVLQARYRLQAVCYAYATLVSFGVEAIDTVELAFVRPEAAQDGQMEEVVYAFAASDIAELEAEITRSLPLNEAN